MTRRAVFLLVAGFFGLLFALRGRTARRVPTKVGSAANDNTAEDRERGASPHLPLTVSERVARDMNRRMCYFQRRILTETGMQETLFDYIGVAERDFVARCEISVYMRASYGKHAHEMKEIEYCFDEIGPPSADSSSQKHDLDGRNGDWRSGRFQCSSEDYLKAEMKLKFSQDVFVALRDPNWRNHYVVNFVKKFFQPLQQARNEMENLMALGRHHITGAEEDFERREAEIGKKLKEFCKWA